MVPKGLGTALKPAHEPIVVSRKPLAGTVIENVLKFGVGALNIEACRVGMEEDADWSQRNGNYHPTVKPTELMRYLVRLVTPPTGIVLDQFIGSGSTGKAAMIEQQRLFA